MAKSYNQIVLFGDSLFQGASEAQNGFSFQGSLQTFCIRRLDVINRGFSGYNSRQALEALPQVFAPASPSVPKIDYLLVLLGANDACRPVPAHPQSVPLDEYTSNLRSIIQHPYITSHSPKILLVTPPPLDEVAIQRIDLATGYNYPTRRAAVSASYSEAARKVAAEVPGVVLIDLQKALLDYAATKTPGWDVSAQGPLGYPGGQSGYLSTLLPDGLHLNGEAYQVLWELVKPHFGPFDRVHGTDYVFPDWKVISPHNGNNLEALKDVPDNE